MTTPTTEHTLPRLQQRYRDEIAPALRDEFQIKNVMQTPSLVKIVVNMGVGEAARDSKLIDGAVRDLATRRRPALSFHQTDRPPLLQPLSRARPMRSRFPRCPDDVRQH